MVIKRRLIYPQSKMANLFSFTLPFVIECLKTIPIPNKIIKLITKIQIKVFHIICISILYCLLLLPLRLIKWQLHHFRRRVLAMMFDGDFHSHIRTDFIIGFLKVRERDVLLQQRRP